MPLDATALAAAACIVLAHRASGERFGSASSWPAGDNEVYWHTREAVMERRVELGLRVGQYLMRLPEAYLLEGEELEAAAGDLWYDVCHPEVLAREVLET